jgi:hypothetical protein
MGTEDFACPKCSQVNTANQTTCKNCGADLKQILGGSKHKEKTTRAYPTLILGTIAVAILGVIAFYVMVLFPNSSHNYYSHNGLSAAKGVGSAVHATIQAEHSDYLNNGDKYTLDDVLANTSFTGGITYNTTPNNTPAIGDICSNVAGNKICVNYKGEQFDWDWTAQVGKTPALLTENSTSAFP